MIKKAAYRSAGDEIGSILPLMLFGVGLLLVAAMTLVSANALLLQQRRLSATADALAVAAANEGIEFISGVWTWHKADASAVLVRVEQDLSDRTFRVVAMTYEAPDKVTIKLCEPAKSVILRVASGHEVCASSASKAVNGG